MPRLRLVEPKLARHLVDAARLRQLGFAQVKLAVLLAQLVEGLLFALHAIAALDGGEVLQAVNHDQREQHGDGGENTRISRTRTGSRPSPAANCQMCMAK